MTRTAWILPLLCCLFLSCGGTDVSSPFRTRAIVIDADAGDWSGLPLYTEDNTSYAVCNDSAYLYILLTTSDRSLQRRFSVMGVNLWFDAAGGSDKTFGIHYPARMPGSGMTPSMEGRDTQENGPEEPPRIMGTMSGDMEILGPGADERTIVPLAEVKDVQIKMSNASGQLVLELRVPLVRDADHPHGIGAALTSVVGMGIETPKFDGEKMRQRMGGRRQPPDGQGGGMPPGEGGGMPPGGRTGGGRGGRGGPGGRGGADQGQTTSKDVELWAKVTLSGK